MACAAGAPASAFALLSPPLCAFAAVFTAFSTALAAPTEARLLQREEQRRQHRLHRHGRRQSGGALERLLHRLVDAVSVSRLWRSRRRRRALPTQFNGGAGAIVSKVGESSETSPRPSGILTTGAGAGADAGGALRRGIVSKLGAACFAKVLSRLETPPGSLRRYKGEKKASSERARHRRSRWMALRSRHRRPLRRVRRLVRGLLLRELVCRVGAVVEVLVVAPQRAAASSPSRRRYQRWPAAEGCGSSLRPQPPASPGRHLRRARASHEVVRRPT